MEKIIADIGGRLDECKIWLEVDEKRIELKGVMSINIRASGDVVDAPTEVELRMFNARTHSEVVIDRDQSRAILMLEQQRSLPFISDFDAAALRRLRGLLVATIPEATALDKIIDILDRREAEEILF